MPVKCTSNAGIQSKPHKCNFVCLFLKPIVNLCKRDFFLNKSCKGKVNIDRSYSFLETPVNIFKHVLWITIDYVNNNMLHSISPPFAKRALFLILPQRRRSMLLCLKALALLSVPVHPLENVNKSWAVENLVVKICLQSCS